MGLVEGLWLYEVFLSFLQVWNQFDERLDVECNVYCHGFGNAPVFAAESIQLVLGNNVKMSKHMTQECESQNCWRIFKISSREVVNVKEVYKITHSQQCHTIFLISWWSNNNWVPTMHNKNDIINLVESIGLGIKLNDLSSPKLYTLIVILIS